MSKKKPRYDIKRGRHKKRATREVQSWERLHLPPPPPPWMDSATAAGLAALRRELDPLT